MALLGTWAMHTIIHPVYLLFLGAFLFISGFLRLTLFLSYTFTPHFYRTIHFSFFSTLYILLFISLLSFITFFYHERIHPRQNNTRS